MYNDPCKMFPIQKIAEVLPKQSLLLSQVLRLISCQGDIDDQMSPGFEGNLSLLENGTVTVITWNRRVTSHGGVLVRKLEG